MKRILKKRVMSFMIKKSIVAVLLLFIFLPIVCLGGWIFKITFLLVGVLGLKEMIDLQKHHKKIPLFMIILSLLLFVLYVLNGNHYHYSYGISEQKNALLLLFLFIPCLFYQKEKYTTHEAMYLFGSILFLGTAFSSILFLRTYDMWLFWYLMLVPIVTDIIAQQAGRLFGKHKCAPLISPGKTWEGAIAGTFVSMILSSLFYYHFVQEIPVVLLLSITFLLSIVGQLGDLVFSKIKRENEIKDFSKIIPGHGGILDRMDSILFVVLAYVLLFGVL